MAKVLQFSKILWQIHNTVTGELHSFHTGSLVEASEVADSLGKDYDVFYGTTYNPYRIKRKVV
jgi:lipopolysaccharide biosynthesis protein